MICTKCKQETVAGAVFCPWCGKKVTPYRVNYIDDCGKASVSCGENRLLMELLSGIANYLGKEFKRRNENGGTED